MSKKKDEPSDFFCMSYHTRMRGEKKMPGCGPWHNGQERGEYRDGFLRACEDINARKGEASDR